MMQRKTKKYCNYQCSEGYWEEYNAFNWGVFLRVLGAVALLMWMFVMTIGYWDISLSRDEGVVAWLISTILFGGMSGLASGWSNTIKKQRWVKKNG